MTTHSGVFNYWFIDFSQRSAFLDFLAHLHLFHKLVAFLGTVSMLSGFCSFLLITGNDSSYILVDYGLFFPLLPLLALLFLPERSGVRRRLAIIFGDVIFYQLFFVVWPWFHTSLAISFIILLARLNKIAGYVFLFSWVLVWAPLTLLPWFYMVRVFINHPSCFWVGNDCLSERLSNFQITYELLGLRAKIDPSTPFCSTLSPGRIAHISIAGFPRFIRTTVVESPSESCTVLKLVGEIPIKRAVTLPAPRLPEDDLRNYYSDTMTPLQYWPWRMAVAVQRYYYDEGLNSSTYNIHWIHHWRFPFVVLIRCFRYLLMFLLFEPFRLLVWLFSRHADYILPHLTPDQREGVIRLAVTYPRNFLASPKVCLPIGQPLTTFWKRDCPILALLIGPSCGLSGVAQFKHLCEHYLNNGKTCARIYGFMYCKDIVEARLVREQLRKRVLNFTTQTEVLLFLPNVPHHNFKDAERLVLDYNTETLDEGLSIQLYGITWTTYRCVRFLYSLCHLIPGVITEKPAIQIGIIGKPKFVASTLVSVKASQDKEVPLQWKTMVL